MTCIEATVAISLEGIAFQRSRAMVDAGLVKRFFSKVAVAGPDECWDWTASTAGKGYGQIRLPKSRKNVYAHRLSYEIHNGECPANALVLHSCDNPRCCNPAHLSLGLHKDNSQDMAQKGRHLYGEKNASSVLTEKKVEQIFKLAAIGLSQAAIGRVVQISQTEVGRILRGKRWAHVYVRRNEN
jgi:hypothetical protein